MFSRRSNSGQKWGKVLIRWIFQMLLCQCVRWEQSKAKTPTPVRSPQPRLSENRGAPPKPAQRIHYSSGSRSLLPGSANYGRGSCAGCLTHLTLRWSPFDVSIHTEEPRTEPSWSGRGLWLPASGVGGVEEIFFKKTNMFNSCFIWESVEWVTV